MTLRTDVSALYIDARGPYPALVADCWDEARDAKLYAGPNPVVAHPPCARWCMMANVNAVRYGQRIGDDGGCFDAALASVRRWGGVLEHPGGTMAWGFFGLLKPVRGAWTRSTVDRGWVTEVCQVAYGHAARKRTWLYYCGESPPALADWRDPPASARLVYAKGRKRVRDAAAIHSPVAFAEWLVSLAASARRSVAA